MRGDGHSAAGRPLAGGWTLQSVAQSLMIKPKVAPDPEEVKRLCQRIESLVDTGEFEAAERAVDTAVNDFPGSAEIATWAEKVRKTAKRPSGERLQEWVSEEEAFLRQTLLRVIAAEAGDELQEALQTVEDALKQYPGRTAFRIVEAHLKSRLAGSND